MTPMVLLTLLFTNPLKESPPLGVKFAPNLHKLLPLASAALLSHLQLKWFVLRQASKREQEKQLEREKSLASTLNRKSQKHEDHEGFAPPVC
jgi:hypothetical protein